MRILVVVMMAFLLGACGAREGYPDLGDTPDRPEPTLTPERSEQLSRELEEAREETVSHAREGLEDETEEDQE